MLVLIPSLAVSAVFPIFARAAVDDRIRFGYGVERTLQTAAVFGAWIGICVAVGAPFAIAVVAGPDFDPAVAILRLQAVALPATFVAQTFSFALLSLRRHRALLIASCGSLLLVTGLTAVLVPPYGGRGAAIAVAVAEVALAFILGGALIRAMPRARLGLGVLPRTALATAFGVGVSAAVGGPAVLMVALSTVVYFGALLALRGIPQELIVEASRALSWASRR